MRRVAEPLSAKNGQRVMIAFHLYKRCFSVRLASTRRVAGYTDRIVISHARFTVSASGRMRVLRERKKNVHAFVQGTYADEQQISPDLELREAYYNPYLVSSFVDRETKMPVDQADIAICENGKVYYWCASEST